MAWSELLPSSNLFCSPHGRPTNLELLGQVLRTLIRKISDQEVADSAADKNIFHQSEFQVPSIQGKGREGATAIPNPKTDRDPNWWLTNGRNVTRPWEAHCSSNQWLGRTSNGCSLGGVACCSEDQWLSRTATVIVYGWHTGCALLQE